MRRVTVCTFLAFALSLGAAVVSFHLLAKHMTGSGGAAWFDAGCSDDPNSAANCGAVLASPYSVWPVQQEGEPEGTKHWPVALFGLFYYSALSVWFLGVGAPSRARRHVQLLPLALVTCGLIGSIYFVFVMFTKLDHWCVWCLVTHAMNLAIAVLLVLMWPKGAPAPVAETPARPGQPARNASRGEAAPPDVAVAGRSTHPSFRLVITGLFAALAVIWGQYQLFDKGSYAAVAVRNKDAFQQCRVMVDKLRGDPANLLAAWKNADTCSIPLRPDDPMRTDAAPGTPTMQVVVFSDLECPSCKRFAILFERDIQPLFDNRLTLIYRHHPLNMECNPRIARTMHAHACEAAKMAEAARIIDGPEKFWLAHDYLFNYQSDLEKGKVTSAWLAEQIGVDAAQLRATMDSPDILERIDEDIAQAGTCSVTSTPTVYVDEKLVDSIARSDIRFWDRLADEFWAKAGVSRPERTTLASRNATRDTPGQTGGQ